VEYHKAVIFYRIIASVFVPWSHQVFDWAVDRPEKVLEFVENGIFAAEMMLFSRSVQDLYPHHFEDYMDQLCIRDRKYSWDIATKCVIFPEVLPRLFRNHGEVRPPRNPSGNFKTPQHKFSICKYQWNVGY
jgi:hypothetical protein